MKARVRYPLEESVCYSLAFLSTVSTKYRMRSSRFSSERNGTASKKSFSFFRAFFTLFTISKSKSSYASSSSFSFSSSSSYSSPSLSLLVFSLLWFAFAALRFVILFLSSFFFYLLLLTAVLSSVSRPISTSLSKEFSITNFSSFS